MKTLMWMQQGPMMRYGADRLDHIARKLRAYLEIYTGDKEGREMAAWCNVRATELRSGLTDAQSKRAWNPNTLSTSTPI